MVSITSMTPQRQTALFLVFALLFLSACSQLTAHAVKQEEITIGFIGPLTGDAAVFGEAERNIIELAVEEINQAGGINGTPISVIYEDGKCTEKDAVTAAHKLIEIDEVPIILAFCSAETLPIIPLTEAKGIIVFTASTNPALSDMADGVFRASYSDHDIALVAAETIAKKAQKVGIIYELTTYPVGLKDAFAKEFEALGGIAYAEGFSQNEHDVRTHITKLLAQHPDAIFIDPDTPATGLSVLKQLNELRFNGTLYGNYFGSSSDIVSAPEADGLIFFADPVVEENELKQQVFQKYRMRYGENPQFEFFAATMYDSVYILKRALEVAGTNPDKVRDYLYDMENYTGLMGTYHFNEKGDAVGIRPNTKMIKGKQIVDYFS